MELIVQRPAKELDLEKEIVFTDWERLRQANLETRVKEIFDQSISVSPNPIKKSETITISFEQTFKVNRINISNLSGRILKSIDLSNSELSFIKLELDQIETTEPYLLIKIVGEGERLFIRKVLISD